MVTKRYNFRIYPTKTQEEQILKNFGSCRFVYNYFLAERIERYKERGEMYSYVEMCRALTRLKKQAEYEWLAEADASSLHTAVKNMDNAFTRFFRRVKQGGAAPGFPKFKSKREPRQSYINKNAKNIQIGKREIKLSKLGWVKCRVSKHVNGRLLNAAVIRAASGKYYVSLCFTDVPQSPLPQTGAAAGLSLGLTDLVTTSDGLRYKNNRFAEQSHKKTAKLYRELSRKTKDSENYEKARIKLARATERVANQRADALNKMTTELVRTYDVICVRDEPIARMLESKKISALLKDASWGEIIRQLEYKCEWYGKCLVKIDPLFASSQLCGSCGFKYEYVRKNSSLQEWDCPKCGARHNRAVNAAANILREGTRLSVG